MINNLNKDCAAYFAALSIIVPHSELLEDIQQLYLKYTWRHVCITYHLHPVIKTVRELGEIEVPESPHVVKDAQKVYSSRLLFEKKMLREEYPEQIKSLHLLINEIKKEVRKNHKFSRIKSDRGHYLYY